MVRTNNNKNKEVVATIEVTPAIMCRHSGYVAGVLVMAASHDHQSM